MAKRKTINKIIIEIRAGAGGDEASLFAADLARMYKQYASNKGWKFKVTNYNKSDIGGYKSLNIAMAGKGAYNDLRFESGVHRVQRVPETEKSGRIHTSTVSVAVLPLLKTKDVKIDPNDLDISFFRASGPGGQHVNKVETAVRITHEPTGVTVSSQNERSQARNRERAMALLRAKLYEYKQQKKRDKLGKMRKQQIGDAERAEKIRTYNYPQNRITDHRINKKWKQLKRIVEDGEFDKIVKTMKSSDL